MGVSKKSGWQQQSNDVFFHMCLVELLVFPLQVLTRGGTF